MNILGGRMGLCEDLFNISSRSSAHHYTINEKMGINHKSSFSSADYDGRTIGYFTIGKGGSNNNNIPHEVKNYETSLYDMVPFRYVLKTADLNSTDRAKYRLRKEISANGKDYIAYYAKKLEPSSITINLKKGTRSGVDYAIEDGHTVFADSTHPLNNTPIISFITFTIKIEKEEFKEFYKAENNSLVGAKIDELGFLYGKDEDANLIPGDSSSGTYTEVSCSEMFSKLTFAPIFLSSDSSSVSWEYFILT